MMREAQDQMYRGMKVCNPGGSEVKRLTRHSELVIRNIWNRGSHILEELGANRAKSHCEPNKELYHLSKGDAETIEKLKQHWMQEV
jgi:hypothetical protein